MQPPLIATSVHLAFIGCDIPARLRRFFHFDQ
jgi:hypothetical protein